MKTLFNQEYSAEFTEKCRKALEANFGEIPLPKRLGSKKRRAIIEATNIKATNIEPVFAIELISQPKSVKKRNFKKIKKAKKRNFVIKLKTKEIITDMNESIFF